MGTVQKREENGVNKEKTGKILWPLGTLVILITIFFFSSQDGAASSLSSGFFSRLLTGIFPPDTASFVVRKTAHFTIYALLGFFALRSCTAWGLKSTKAILYCFLFCVLYASSDEIHQLFSDGRSGQIRDVMLDSAGAISGIEISWLILLHKKDKI